MTNQNEKFSAQTLGQSLKDLISLEHDARGFGFDWPNFKMVIQQAVSECEEIEEAIINNESPARIQEEVGDLLHAVIYMCVFFGYDMEEMFRNINKKFGKRMAALKAITHEHGLPDLKGQSIDFMLNLWKKAKSSE